MDEETARLVAEGLAFLHPFDPLPDPCDIPADLVELHEVLEWEAAVEAEQP